MHLEASHAPGNKKLDAITQTQTLPF